MDAVVNLHREPALREKLDYHPVHNNTVLIDDRTEWRNPFRAGPGVSRTQALARYRADLWRRIRGARSTSRSLPGSTAAGWPAGATSTVMARCSPAPPPGPRRCWRSGKPNDRPLRPRGLARRSEHRPRPPCRAAPAKGTVQVERNSLPT